MLQEQNNLISVSELAILTKSYKSKLAYYAKLELIKPVAIVGRMHLYDKATAIKLITKIQSYQKKGIPLREIKEKLAEVPAIK